MDADLNQRHFRGVDEAARFFRVSPDTVRGWREAGAPFLFIGKKWQASYDDLWSWLKTFYLENPVK